MRVAATHIANKLQKAVEAADVDELLQCYTDDAEVQIIDRDHPPSSPLHLRGKQELESHFRDISHRNMSHSVQAEVYDDDHLAYTEACRYNDGTQVLATSMCELRNGRIHRETIVQAWDS